TASAHRAPAARPSFVQRLHQLAKRIRPMADAVLELGVELSEGIVVADRLKHGVIAEPFVAARRPDEGTVDAAFECLDLAVVGPGDRQRANEMRGGSSVRLRRLDLAPDLLH